MMLTLALLLALADYLAAALCVAAWLYRRNAMNTDARITCDDCGTRFPVDDQQCPVCGAENCPDAEDELEEMRRLPGGE